MRFCGIAKLTGVVCIALMMFASESAQANGGGWGGSWGGSHGSWGSSYGSWGGSYGSWGGSRGGLFARRPVRNLVGRIGDRLHYRRSFGYASYGGSYGSWGGSHGSVGSSVGYSYGSTGSYYANTVANYDCYQAYQPACGCTISAPVPSSPSYYDQVPNVPGGDPVENPEETQRQPNGDPAVGPGNGESIQNRRLDDQRSVLAVRVPEEAMVYINGYQTKTTGTSRRYLAEGMQPGQKYRYNVKVVLERNGQEIVREDSVVLKPGVEHKLTFDFNPVPTTLTVNVPADAKVVLCGNKTNSVGEKRSFSTQDLVRGEVWQDYSIVVEVERNGELLTERRNIDIVGGEMRQLTFDFNQATIVAAR